MLDNGFWDITADYAKETPEDLVIELQLEIPATGQTLHVLPTVWFRNTWAWGITDTVPTLHVENQRIVCDHTVVGRMFLTGDGDYTPLVCDNELNAARLWGSPPRTAFPKDGINDHVVNGASTVNLAQAGTKAALHYVLECRSRVDRDHQTPLRSPRDRCRGRCGGGARHCAGAKRMRSTRASCRIASRRTSAW